MKLKDYYFYYADQYRSGAFDIREVVSWQSEGKLDYLKYVIRLKDGNKVALSPEEFKDFETAFNLAP